MGLLQILKKKRRTIFRAQIFWVTFCALVFPHVIYGAPQNHFNIVEQIAAQTGNLYKENPDQFTLHVAECLVTIDSNWGRRMRWSQINDDVVAYRIEGNENPYVVDIIKNANSPNPEIQWLEGDRYAGFWKPVNGNCMLNNIVNDDNNTVNNDNTTNDNTTNNDNTVNNDTNGETTVNCAKLYDNIQALQNLIQELEDDTRDKGWRKIFRSLKREKCHHYKLCEHHAHHIGLANKSGDTDKADYHNEEFGNYCGNFEKCQRLHQHIENTTRNYNEKLALFRARCN